MSTERRFAYYYAVVREDTGMCTQVKDTTNYILDPTYIPIPEYSREYLLKYYYPLPTSVTSFGDFNGQWYTDAAHTVIFDPDA